ncbi:Tho complex subunit 7-domain-containing protein [Phialemonium atrogriseum]|uniref:Tho complex subunit 7-domain-containing protein n=1 Tax=Phialemonium atrogriseum TaxID=1093897 RepID=A0AAJ0FRC4_9PEZI|nr:Tho complex subunit 7-domain-containing protein [Phialemonium atrogriseum]KAK1769995.1 Tho complex subunit 7-domain-containing protein [Phialemonium atrogriseum]
MSSWNLLDEREEAELHKSRLLNIEEKPFKRVTKRLVTLNTLVAAKARQAPTPPPESSSANGANGADAEGAAAEAPASPTDPLLEMKEDIVLDFAAFDGSVTRLQFLLSANERERARYAADRVRILETSQGVRDSTAGLRQRLERARATLEQRRKFDDLAEKITSNRMLRPRGDQEANLRKLEDECAQLEAESETYAATWRERKDQFSRIMDESMRLRRLIRDEKEEVERREGMDDEGGQGDAEADSVQTPRPGLASGNATPRPDSGLIPTKGGLESGDAAGASRPASTAGGVTPARESPGLGGESRPSLKPRPEAAGSFSRSESRAASRNASPNRSRSREREEPEEPEEGEDVEMDDAKESVSSPLTPLPSEVDTPRIVVDSQEVEDKMDTT